MANSFSPPRRNAMAPVQPVANVPMAVAPLYSAPTPQDAEVLKRFLLGAGKAALAGIQFPGDLMHDAARSLRAGRPAGVYADLVETARRVSRDPAAVPGMVVNALKSQAEQARSSPGAMAETMGGMLDVRNMLKPKPQKPVVFAIDKPYNFKKESQRVSNLVHAENVTLADYEPKVRTPNKTYAYVGNRDRRGNATRFELKRDFENGTGIRVYVGSDYPYEDLPDPRYDPNNPPLMYASTVAVEGTDVAPAPVGRGAATQMTLEALNIAKRGKGGWMSEGMGSLETQAKYKRLIDAGVPFQRLEDGTYYLMPEDLATLDLNKVSEALNKKYAGGK